MIRPQPARWFEAVCARDDALLLLEALAATRSVEVEWHAGGGATQADAANAKLREFAALARRYRAYWPRASLRETQPRSAPMAAFADALARIAGWQVQAEPHIAALQECEGALARLSVVQRLLDVLEGSSIDLGDLALAREGVRCRILVYPESAQPSIPPHLLARSFECEGEAASLVVGAPAAIEQMEREVAALHGRAIELPAWLERDAQRSRAILQAKREAAQRGADAARTALDALGASHQLAHALGDVARATWCFENVAAIDAGAGVLARITGWTNDATRLVSAVEESGARAVVAFPPRPAGTRAPLLLRNPWWARPFELFSRLFGMPSGEGADPTALLALVAPLLFGYMFGDAGQGFVLLAAGFFLRRRIPEARLLVPGGIAAIVFGWVFGSVFGREGWIEPLWIAPLSDPITVLAVPIAFGAALLTVGLALRGLEAYWRGSLGEWLACEAGFVAVYGGLLLAVFHRAGFAIAAAGVVACIAGAAVRSGHLPGALGALGELVERTLQILVNTISFARVGAFALAHAGLSTAIVSLAEATGSTAGAIAVMVAGNAVVLVLEGLVVGIQTTRLILFEFCIRFFDSRGREFRPLLPPTALEDRP